METFSELLALCAGNSPHKSQWCRALMFSLICTLNKRWSKQSWGWWFEMPSCWLWRHCNDLTLLTNIVDICCCFPMCFANLRFYYAGDNEANLINIDEHVGVHLCYFYSVIPEYFITDGMAHLTNTPWWNVSFFRVDLCQGAVYSAFLIQSTYPLLA